MSEMHAAGRLEDHPFAELAGLIFREGLTGELTLESAQRRRSVWFLGGNPVAVVSADPHDHLAQFLLEHGRITPEDAQRLAELAETREALGAAEYLPKETLNWGVKSRFVNLCYDLFRWEDGDYAFHEGDPPRELFLLKVPAHSLIFKGAGFVSQATVAEAVPDDGVCGPGPIAPDEARYLGPDMRKALDECRPGRSVADVLGSGWDDLDQARRMLYALTCLGLLAIAPAPEAAPAGLEAEPEEAPAFSFDEGFGQTETATATLPALDEENLGAPQQSPAGGLDFTLPPLDHAPSAPIEFPPGTPPAGGYPFEQEAAAGSFGSFASDMSLDHGDEPPPTKGAAKDKGRKGSPKPAGGRFHVPRIAGIAVGGLAAAALIGGAAWWWLSNSEPPPRPVKPPIKRPAAEAPAPTAVAPVVVPAIPPPAQPAPPSAAAPVAPSAASAPPAPVASAPAPAAAVPAPPPKAAAPLAAPAPGAGGDRYRNALEIFRAGDLDGAAAIWESLLADEHRSAFTLLLLTACQPETIRDAQRALSSQRLFLVTKDVKGRQCFRVCLETFDSREAASRALAALPPAFRTAGAAVRPVAEVLKR